MHRAFGRLPLPAKLLLIGFIPLVLLIYMFFQIYREKTQKVNLLSLYIENIHQSTTINFLIESLQKERKYSFDYAIRRIWPAELAEQRMQTDAAMELLEKSTLAGFTHYTFLDKLQETRGRVDSLKTTPDLVMHYYSTTVYRMNTLNVVSPGMDTYLQSLHKDLIAQKLLSEMITSLGIIRSNIYNVLYTRKYMIETLIGMIGVYDVYKTYEIEFFQKSSPAVIEEYNKIKTKTTLKPTLKYIDTLFKRFSFDSTYDAARWWKLSEEGTEQLSALQRRISDNVTAGANGLLNKEKNDRRESLIFLIVTLVIVISFVFYTISSITRMLRKMKQAAQAISKGAPAPQMNIESNDAMGALAQSIAAIDANNKLLADAAQAIGQGSFDVPVRPRSKEDILGNAVSQMKENLVHYIRSNRETNEQLTNLAQKYKTIFLKSPLPKWIYDYTTLKFLEVNEAAIKHYGYSEEEFLNMSIKDIRPPEEVEELYKDIELLKTTGKSSHKYWKHVKKNGEIIIVEVMAHFIEYNKQNARMVVLNDVTEKIKAEKALKQSHEQLRELASHLQNIREEERASMAREVHDVLGQQVTCIKMDISWLTKQLATNDPKIKQKLQELTTLLDETAVVVRKIASALRPSILDDFGLADALEWQGREFEKRSGIKVHCRSNLPEDFVIGKNIATGLFRICQESLTNVARHAAATEVTIHIESRNEQLILEITDNGKGFDVEKSAARKTLGLLGMKERTLMIGGKYEIASTPGKGTTVTVTVSVAMSLPTDK
jgi:PAS domain S-box-containing protein